jgi:hypothetical protein
MPIVAPGKVSQQIHVVDPVTGTPKETAYKIFANGEEILKGKTDALGKTSRHLADETAEMTVLVGPKKAWTIEYVVPDLPVPNHDDHDDRSQDQ